MVGVRVKCFRVMSCPSVSMCHLKVLKLGVIHKGRPHEGEGVAKCGRLC